MLMRPREFQQGQVFCRLWLRDSHAKIITAREKTNENRVILIAECMVVREEIILIIQKDIRRLFKIILSW